MLNKEEFINGLNIADKTIEELSSLIDLLELKISSDIGVPVNPIEYTYMEDDFKGKVVELDMFPVLDGLLLMIDEDLIQSKDMKIDYNAGLIYLKEKHAGFLEAKYNYGLTPQQYETHIKPLITDMIHYKLNHGWDKNATSIKEGEIQINYDTSLSDGALIQAKLNQLKNMFNIRVAMI